MTEVSEIENESIPSKKRRSVAARRARAGALIFAFVAPPVVGGFFGHTLAMDSERSSNRADLHRAVGLERCIPDVQSLINQGKTVIRASQLSVAVQEDCGLKTAIGDARSGYKKAVSDANYDAHQGAKIINDVDPSVQLPGVDRLQLSIKGLEDSAATTGTGGPALDTFYGAMGGLVADVIGVWIWGHEMDKRMVYDGSVHTV